MIRYGADVVYVDLVASSEIGLMLDMNRRKREKEHHLWNYFNEQSESLHFTSLRLFPCWFFEYLTSTTTSAQRRTRYPLVDVLHLRAIVWLETVGVKNVTARFAGTFTP